MMWLGNSVGHTSSGILRSALCAVRLGVTFPVVLTALSVLLGAVSTSVHQCRLGADK